MFYIPCVSFKSARMLLLIFSLFLPKGSFTIQGRRVRVYQPEFEECWASGMVSQHDPISHIMEITLDKVNNTYVKSVIGMHGLLLLLLVVIIINVKYEADL